MKRSPKKKVTVLYSPGTNCEEETMEAIRRAGGNPRLVFLRDLYKGREKSTDCDLFIVPGGFSFGDHLEAGVATATFLHNQFIELKDTGIPILGICNGNQILVRVGLLGPGLAMVRNESGFFRSGPFRHRVLPSNCVWTQGLEGRILEFPAAHGYGRLVGDPQSVVMEYDGPTPNGSRVAMISDSTGRIAVLMDHPERPPDNEDGLAIFRCGLAAV